MQFADDTDPDQPAQERRLIRAFVASLQKQWIMYIYSICQGTENVQIRLLNWTFAVCIMA